MFLRAFENWARNVVVIGTLAGSPYTRFFGCECCYHGNGKREKTRKRRAKWGVRQLLSTCKNVAVRVFPSVEKLREQHQIWRYLESPVIAEGEDGYQYSMTAFCSECKRVRVAKGVRAEARLLKVAWRYRDGSLALSKVSEETWAEVVEWADRRGERWGQMWGMREGWRVWRARRIQARLAEWEMEEELARMQIDAEITDVASEESANSGCEEESVLVESHELVGIYFGRR